MKRFWFIITLIMAVSSCSMKKQPPPPPHPLLMNEDWINDVKASADNLDYLDKPRPYDLQNKIVGPFSNIEIRGNLQVRLVGQDYNSYAATGTDASKIGVVVWDDTLYITEPERQLPENVTDAIIVVGIPDLQNFTVEGDAKIVGMNLRSDRLNVTSVGNSKIALKGNLNLSRLKAEGNGWIAINGIDSQALVITIIGNEQVNLAGRMSPNYILHKGNGTLNLVGSTGGLSNIFAEGRGTTAIQGFTNLQSIKTYDNARVYLYWVKGCKDLKITAYGNSEIGLAGTTDSIKVATHDNAQFLGQYLHAKYAEAKSDGSSHINIASSKKMFARADGGSSIYYYGPPDKLSGFGSGLIIPAWRSTATLPLPNRATTYPSIGMITPTNFASEPNWDYGVWKIQK